MPFRIFGKEFGEGPSAGHPAVRAVLEEAAGHRAWFNIRRANELAAGKAALASSETDQVAIVLAALGHMAALTERGRTDFVQMVVLGKLVSDILRRDLPFSEPDIVAMLDHARGVLDSYGHTHLGGVVKATERFVEQFGLSAPVRAAIEGLLRRFGPAPTRQQERKARARLEALIEGEPSDLELTKGEPWADAVAAALAAMSEPERTAWRRLLVHAQSGSGAAPTQKWLKRAAPLVAAIGADRLRDRSVEWMSHVRPPKEPHPPVPTMEAVAASSLQVAQTLLADLDDRGRAAWQALSEMSLQRPAQPDVAWSTRFGALLAAAGGPSLLQRVSEQVRHLAGGGPLLPERNADALRGLVWMCSLLPADPPLAVTLGDVAERCLKKVPNYGAYSSKVGHACIWTLGAMSGMEPVAQLGRLKQRVKYPVSLRLVEKALAEAAQRASISPDDLEELAVPNYGLTEPALGRTTIGAYTATVRVASVDEVDVRWTGPNGRPQKAVPKDLIQANADELKQLKRSVKDIGGMLPAQRDRIERLYYAGDRHWPLAQWRARYLDHPLLAVVARRLIWHFQDGQASGLAVFDEGRLVGLEGTPLPLTDAAEVRLWHPLGFPAETVRAWRNWLRDHEVRQPFKQAHREIYVLTDAEQQTSTYSNRFAAHIIRQHQFAALCRERGWRYHVQGSWDSHNLPTLALPRFGLQAEFWVEPVAEHGSDESASGVYMQLATDQVRFTGLDGTPRPLAEVPALLFSEVMRDVDLFVGVTSIGADPAWGDRGDERARAYWRDYAFGELNAAAHTRREVLAAVLPKLKIATRCRLEGRFLEVRGQIRTYKIHLGSGNVQMEPNGQYLCIVPDRRAGGEGARSVALPFEGDNTLAIIISKAILLAADDRITDETIVRQIRSS